MSPRTVRSVDRAIDILVTLGDRDFRLVELSERLKLHKATVSRLLETMGRAGMVTRTDSGSYSVGARMVLLAGQLLRRHRRIAEVLRDPLHRIWQQTAETVALHIRVGLEDAPFGCATANPALVEEAVGLIRAAGGEPATVAQMRAALAALTPRSGRPT